MKSQAVPPKEETASTISSAPCSAATGPMASRSFMVPDGVSQWTTATTLTSGRCPRAFLTLSAGTALS